MLTKNRNIIIYRDQLLPFSETFIPQQVEQLRSYTGFYTGTTKFSDGESLLPKDRTTILSDLIGKNTWWKTAYKVGGVIYPQWRKSLENLSPCLIHAHFGLDGVLALPLANKLNLPLIVTFHGYFATTEIKLDPQKTWINWMQDFAKRRGTFYRELYMAKLDRLFQEADCIIAISEFIRSQLIVKGCPPEKIKVHYIGVDIEQFKPDPNIKRQPIVLFVGRLVEKKGCEYLIRAMAQVQKIIPDAELVIIGNGDLRSRLEKLAADLLSKYRFLGVQTPEQVKTWMNKACVFSVPSIFAKSGDAEGFGIVFAEAQAMGLPVVSFASGGIPEAVTHHKTGFLAPEKDIDMLSKYITTLLQDRQLRQNIAAAGRQQVETRFNLKRQTLELEKIYDEIRFLSEGTRQ